MITTANLAEHNLLINALHDVEGIGSKETASVDAAAQSNDIGNIGNNGKEEFKGALPMERFLTEKEHNIIAKLMMEVNGVNKKDT
ncbi:hypothetical protein GJ744_009466 [Endocarpon pusillum]|uniref:Uncharacterized protein n=1 Tax=Endocarpon pusillum TaxID=364733 RepID=A0A8H7AHG0_9EURO|nr:hypothetical protein GJ744_009466 [Endocarpon pusillum]